MKKIYAVLLSIIALFLIFITGCGGTTEETVDSDTTPIHEELFLDVRNPADEVIVDVPLVVVSGTTLADAMVSINGALAYTDYQGAFSGEIELEEGPNVIEVVASDFYGNEKAKIITLFYIP